MSSLRDQLQTIYEQHGKLTPELVVEAARPDDHPLHTRVFDRAPREAAEAWYRHRAHDLIQSVKVVYRDEAHHVDRSVRAFHAVRSDGPGSYTYEPVEKVVADPFTKQLVLREMEREWRQLLHRYESFREFTELVAGDLEVLAA